MKKIIIILCTFFCLVVCLTSCKKKTYFINYILDGGTNNPNNPTEYIEGKEVTLYDATKTDYDFVGWFIGEEKITKITKEQKGDLTLTAHWDLTIKPPFYNTKVTIDGPTSVKSGQSITFTATVTDLPADADASVSWQITSGSEYATIDQNGKLTAKEVSGDQIITVTAISNYDSTITNSVKVTIVAPAVLTQAMLDNLNSNKLGFEGYVNVKLYSIGLFSKLEGTYTYNITSRMDGSSWYTEYEDGNTGQILSLFYKEHNGLACQVGVSLMNDEKYVPMIENGHEVSWTDSGFYNNFTNLKVSDFTYNEKTGRYDYTGSDQLLDDKMIASANPYSFVANGFSLIIEGGEIAGIYAQSGDDYTIQTGYRAVQELISTINVGDIVEVPTIGKYQHDEVHDDLVEAINNMRSLTSYKLTFMETTASIFTSTPEERGYDEYITADNLYFDPFTVSHQNSKEIHNFADFDSYGYKKINDQLYNTYFENPDGSFEAARAYEASLSEARPSFAFAAEIFTSYYPEADGSITYYVDNIMANVATTFYYGVGNDINLYGIYATSTVYTSVTTPEFKPYVVVKDGYIQEACFYYYLGSMYGVVDITYSGFNETTIPDGINVEFDTRLVPTSWNDVVVNDPDTDQEIAYNAKEYLEEFLGVTEIDNELPFFDQVLGDTYGFALITSKILPGTNIFGRVIDFYFDVPLDIDYSITTSLAKIEALLVANGYVKNDLGYYEKGNICVYPYDSSLDLNIDVWKKA